MRTAARSITTLGFSLLLVAVPSAGVAASAGEKGWKDPRCVEVVSDGSLSYTRDGGTTVTPTTTKVQPNFKLVYGLEALATPNKLLAVDVEGQLTRSTDGGCRWREFATIGSGYWSIAPAADGSAYLSELRGDRVYRVSGTQVTEAPAFDTEAHGKLLTLTADQRDPRHLRALTMLGQVLDSTDGGKSFQAVGTRAPLNEGSAFPMVYDGKISPRDPDRVVLGMSDAGGFTSADGGRTWQRTAVGAAGDQVNGFSLAISPVDPRVVYMKGLNITELNAGQTGRHLYRSTDGGQSFSPVVSQGKDITIPNGGWIEPSPWDRDVVHFEFGDRMSGTYLYTYDAGTGKLSIGRNAYDGIGALAFNPAHRDVMYLGLTAEPLG